MVRTVGLIKEASTAKLVLNSQFRKKLALLMLHSLFYIQGVHVSKSKLITISLSFEFSQIHRKRVLISEWKGWKSLRNSSILVVYHNSVFKGEFEIKRKSSLPSLGISQDNHIHKLAILSLFHYASIIQIFRLV